MAQHFLHVCGIEIEGQRVEWAKKRIPTAEIECGSATSLPWPDNEFDLVTSTDVFEHISTSQQHVAAAEMFRVTKRGGCGFVKVPNRFQLYDEHNYIKYATWLPNSLRKHYVQLKSKNPYVQCWERTGRGWEKLFKQTGFQVVVKPVATRYLFFPCGYRIYLRKV